jgi:Na+/H+-dicarboxylate symporter
MFLAILARALAGERIERLRRGVERAAQGSLRVAAAVLLFTPVGVFALAFGLGFGAGLGAVGFLTFCIVTVCLLLTLGTLGLYPIVRWLGGMPVRTFARGVAPAQIIALSTRSSLVSLPAMIEGANTHLRLPPAAAGFVLPFAVSVSKLSMAFGHVYMLLLTAHVFGPALSLSTVLVAAASLMLMSIAVPGIPGGNPAMTTLPVFVAAGVPAQAILMLDAVDAIPDIFKTVLNVTTDMAAAVVVTAGERGRANL